MSKEDCLLIGNGINRCCNGKSWETLLDEIARQYFVSKNTIDSNALAFEQLRYTVLSRNINCYSDKFAMDILKGLDKISQDEYNEIFSHFLELPLDNILTTNFDYAIERSLVESYKFEENKGNLVMPQETKASTIRHSQLKGKNIFHIHGELGKEKTICLGNVHYAENLVTIMNRLIEKDEEKDEYKLKKSVFEEKLISWAQFFFTKQIYVVGLGLYDCDADLWWLIAYRQQLKLEGDKRINNKIVYYYLYEKRKNQSFIDCLKAMGLEVRELEVDNGNWAEAYISVSKDIMEALNE